MKTSARISMAFLDKDLVPDWLIRTSIRGLLKGKINSEEKDGVEFGQERFQNLINQMKGSPVAVNTTEANEQHYEVPSEFFQLVMGKHMKYSCGYWRNGTTDFDKSEYDMLKITVERADIQNGQEILELGCGWGSLSLYMAEHFPKSHITGVSNSATQQKYILEQAKQRNLNNLEIITADMNEFSIDKKFDRVVSVEMFEHMRNYKELMARIAKVLKENGKLFIHIFTHRDLAYLYKIDNSGFDWMAKYFFTGGIMPSDHLLLYFQDDFAIEHHWRVNGTHYEKTSNGWLQNMDKNKEKIIPILKETYGETEYKKWWVYWRVFFMACAELWGYKGGSEWFVSHYLFRKR